MASRTYCVLTPSSAATWRVVKIAGSSASGFVLAARTISKTNACTRSDNSPPMTNLRLRMDLGGGWNAARLSRGLVASGAFRESLKRSRHRGLTLEGVLEQFADHKRPRSGCQGIFASAGRTRDYRCRARGSEAPTARADGTRRIGRRSRA